MHSNAGNLRFAQSFLSFLFLSLKNYKNSSNNKEGGNKELLP